MFAIDKYWMRMLVDWHDFSHHVSVPWPIIDSDWQIGLFQIESWLKKNIGPRLTVWAWHDSGRSQYIGVAFRCDRDKLLFVLTWS